MLRSRPEFCLLLAGLASISACAGHSASVVPEPVPAAAQQRITLDDAEIRTLAEILRLEDRREYDAVAFRRYLNDPNPEIRRRAVLALGRIQDQRSGLRLLSVLKDDSVASVRAAAAFAFGQFDDTAELPFHELTLQVDDTTINVLVRAEAAAALGKLRSRVMSDSSLEFYGRVKIRSILDLAADSTSSATAPPSRVVEDALLASWHFQRDPLITTPVIHLSRSPDSGIRWRATYALMRFRDPAGVDALLDRRHDAEPLVRALAIRGLYAPIVDSAGRRDTAIQALTEAIRDPHPHVRINAVRALAAFPGAENTAAIVRLLDDPDPNVVLAAAESLGNPAHAPAASALERIAREPTTRPAIRSAALAALLRIDPELALPIAASWAGTEEWLGRFYVARALAATTDAGAVRLLGELVRDSDPRVAATALAGFAGLPREKTAGFKRLFIEQLGAADIGVRTNALRALATHSTAADLPLLLDAYDHARHDRANNAARAAIAALGALAEQKVPVQNSFFHRFERSADPIIRREVREALGPGNWGEVFPIETGRDLEFYEEVVRTYIAPYLAGAPLPRAVIHTAGGAITIELAAPDAPLTVRNFMTLAERGYYDGFRWHRVVPNFVLQDGDPRGDGAGGPGYRIRDEFNQIRYLRGTVGMALDGPDTGGSQFFITHAPQPHLDGRYTVFGEVVAGLEVADRVAQDDPIERIEIVRTVASQPR